VNEPRQQQADRADAAADVLDALAVLVRQLGLHGEEHPDVQQATSELTLAINDAQPPFALNLVGEAVLCGREPLPAEVGLYRRNQALVGAMRKFGARQLRLTAVPSSAALLRLAGALLDATQGSGRTRAPQIDGVEFMRLRLLGDSGAADAAENDTFITEQLERATAAIHAIMTRETSTWPFRRGKRVLQRVERCISVDPAAATAAHELAAGTGTRARRALGAVLLTTTVLSRLGAPDLVRRSATHALLALCCHGLDERGGAPLSEAAQATLQAMVRTSRRSVDPHRLRATALVYSLTPQGARAARAPAEPLLRIAYDMERARAPVGPTYELSKVDLWAWLADAVARGEVDRDWGEVVLSTPGGIPPGAHVMADNRLGVVMGPAGEEGDAQRPRVLVAGELCVPRTPVRPHSPLGMTPWAK
jgi:hypothetical protein